MSTPTIPVRVQTLVKNQYLNDIFVQRYYIKFHDENNIIEEGPSYTRIRIKLT